MLLTIMVVVNQPDITQILRTRDMLPAIWFIFSRRDCDQAAVRCAESGTVLTTEEERSIIQQEVGRIGFYDHVVLNVMWY